MNIELIVPCYNEEKCIELFYNRICEVFKENKRLSEKDFLITFINDGSRDNSVSEMKRISEKDKRVRYISLSRNFGKESAMYAGLSNSIGDYVAVLDADLQHPPELMEEMLIAIEDEGYDCASARRVSRKGEPVIRSAFSRAFYHIINKVTSMDLTPGGTDYRLMKRTVVDAIVSMGEHERFTKGIYSWVGFKNKWIEYHNVERVAGKTTWSFWGLIKYAYSGFIAFATTPLRGVIYFGLLVVLGAVVFAASVFIDAIRNPEALRTGYNTILIVLLLLGGVIIVILGMIGEYMARIYMEVKNRPIYIIGDTNISYDKKREINVSLKDSTDCCDNSDKKSDESVL